jgi:hypothetical protein
MGTEKTRLGQEADGAAAAAPSAHSAPASPTGPVEAHDHEEVYCRRLGHHLPFSYCRRAEAGDPCPRVGECWYDRAAVLDYLRVCFGGAEGGAARAGQGRPPAGKLESILAIVARVRAREVSGSPPG